MYVYIYIHKYILIYINIHIYLHSDLTRRKGTPHGIWCYVSLVEQEIRIQMISNISGLY